MTNVAKNTKSFVSYWYTRYLVATELYMVEPWERAVIHVLFLSLFALFWWFNSSIVINGISRFRSLPPNVEQYS